MAQPPKRRLTGPCAAPSERSLAAAGAPDQVRVRAIRDHVLPLIRALACAHRASGLQVLMAVLGPFTSSYRRPLIGQSDQRHRLEIRRRRRLMLLEWTGPELTLLTFQPGPWEQEVMRLAPPRH